MAQRRYFNFLDDDLTHDLNSRDLILLPFGRYCGFDAAAFPASLTLTLNHELTGQVKRNKNLINTPKLGVWRTQQGGIVQEDAGIQLAITDNPGLNPRVDLIVGEHEYIDAEGGATAVYRVIIGIAAAIPLDPALTEPEKQVVLGRLRVPAGMTQLTGVGVTYTPARKPDWYEVHNLLDHVDALQEGPIEVGNIISRSGGKWKNLSLRTLVQLLTIRMQGGFAFSYAEFLVPDDYPYTVDGVDPTKAYLLLSHGHVVLGNNGLFVPSLPVIHGAIGLAEGSFHRLTTIVGNTLSFALNSVIDATDDKGTIYPFVLVGAAANQTIWQPTPNVTAIFTFRNDQWEILDPGLLVAQINTKVTAGGIDLATGFPFAALQPGFTLNGGGANVLFYRDSSALVHIVVGAVRWNNALATANNQLICTAPISTLGSMRLRIGAPLRDNARFVCSVYNITTPYATPKVAHVIVKGNGQISLNSDDSQLVTDDVLDLRSIKYFGA